MKLFKLTILIFVIISLVKPETKHRTHNKHSKFLDKNKENTYKKVDPLSSTYGQDSNFAKDTNILDMVPDPDSSIIDLNIGQGPVHMTQWVKYFKFASDEFQGNRPRTFFKNNEFYRQSRQFPNANLSEKSLGEYKYIKSESFFYLMAFNDRINILTSSLDKFQNTYDTLNFDLITPVIEMKEFKGGITDFGSFSEGFCFKMDTSKKILTEIPNGDVPLTTWIICTESSVINIQIKYVYILIIINIILILFRKKN